MSDLVTRLSQGTHPVQLGLRPKPGTQALKQSLDNGYILVKFTDTQGGTELGVRIDRAASDVSGADFEKERGSIRIAGDLTLDFVKVRCIADIDIATFAGTGRLQPA